VCAILVSIYIRRSHHGNSGMLKLARTQLVILGDLEADSDFFHLGQYERIKLIAAQEALFRSIYSNSPNFDPDAVTVAYSQAKLRTQENLFAEDIWGLENFMSSFAKGWSRVFDLRFGLFERDRDAMNTHHRTMDSLRPTRRGISADTGQILGSTLPIFGFLLIALGLGRWLLGLKAFG